MNTTLKRLIIKAKKQLGIGEPCIAVAFLKLAEVQPVDLDTRKLMEKAREEAEIGSADKAETLLDMIDLKIGDVVISRDGISKGKTTGGERCCSMEGCTGRRLGVRWQDGKLTWPCTKGMSFDTREQVWKLI